MKVQIRSAGCQHKVNKKCGDLMKIKSKNYGIAEIIGDGSKYGYLRVKFINTGNIDEFRKDAVYKGEIRDKYAVSFLGVGIIGNIKTRGKYKPYYLIWRNILHRCYTNTNKAYQNVTVCERWKTFEHFYNDVPLIEGWDPDRFEAGDLDLDKDLKQEFCSSKVYSVETCCWLPKSQNRCLQDKQQHRFKATAPDGSVYYGRNITAFGREHGLERRQISSVLHGRFVSTLGWKFEFVDKEIV